MTGALVNPRILLLTDLLQFPLLEFDFGLFLDFFEFLLSLQLFFLLSMPFYFSLNPLLLDQSLPLQLSLSLYLPLPFNFSLNPELLLLYLPLSFELNLSLSSLFF